MQVGIIRKVDTNGRLVVPVEMYKNLGSVKWMRLKFFVQKAEL